MSSSTRSTSRALAATWLAILALAMGSAAALVATSGPLAAPSRAAQSGPVFPGAEWERAATPEAAGFAARGLAEVRDRLKTLGTTSMMVVSGGRVAMEYGDVAQVSYIASVRKSVLAMLFGKYVENGTIRLDKTLADLKITDHGGLSPQELEATVADLLAARSGVYHAASNPGDSLADAPGRGSKKHGTYFLYSNWDFNALGTIFEQETGRSIFDALDSDLARPIGMQDFQRALHRREGDPRASMHLAYHMHFSTRDMARVGYVMLREGRWGDRQLVPKAWVKRLVTPVTRNTAMNPAPYRNGPFGYGLLWWVFDGDAAAGAYEGAYTGIGAGGQYITVLPKLDMVVAHKVDMDSGGRPVTSRDYFSIVGALIEARTRR